MIQIEIDATIELLGKSALRLGDDFRPVLDRTCVHHLVESRWAVGPTLDMDFDWSGRTGRHGQRLRTRPQWIRPFVSIRQLHGRASRSEAIGVPRASIGGFDV